jgi:glycosyltransferase involved in cell wall biosynthesis
MTETSIAIVIPAFNEAGAIGSVLAALMTDRPPGVTEIIVVDDGSSDGTGAIAEAAGARVIRHKQNRGYGASLKTAVRASTADYILTMDADGQHRIGDVHALCKRVQDPAAADAVIGQRTKLFHSALWRMPGKWFLTFLARILTQKEIKDLNSGLRVMRREIVARYMHLCPAGFSFSTTITVALLSRGYAIDYVPIEVIKRVGKSTVKISTGFQTILLMLRLSSLFNPLRVFLPLAMFLILLGVGWTIPYVIKGNGVTVAALAAMITGVLLFAVGLVCDQVAQLRLERYE